ncbi:sulfate/molybdate ABC transporter ATP-binding protein [Acetobacteraceae bacterium KSS8]|uniref:Sulfate/molybdate ABC transporter ATP-binding protein n=1 Tax=Endosaccharibacter trunci TaxID=2812733 RepID=A0ABT1W5L8_9PROT|nr:sulfate/molybdate ABC transporter ATP-binding protein [Acetobacteraceae bacterium KSS8]
MTGNGMGVALRNVSCVFGRTPAVRGIDLEVARGEFLALVGPSGAGKTTLLRIIAGLQPGYEGSVRIGVRDVTRVPARDRNIGFAFQNYALFPHMNVAANVAFGLTVRPRATRPGRGEIRDRVEALLQLVQVGDLAGRYPSQLSGGQRQRVSLARALATEPELLLLDEPFGALDPLVRKEIRAWLRGLHNRLGLTSILVTHDQEEALEVADRIAVLRDGRIEQIGTPAMLEDAPASPFVHRFLGETVSLPGCIVGGAIRLGGAWEGTGIVPPRVSAPDGPVLLMARPHTIGLLPASGHAPAAEVAGVSRRGAFLRYRVAPAGYPPESGIEIHVPADRPSIPVGRACRLDFSRAHMFPDRATSSVSDAPGLVTA